MASATWVDHTANSEFKKTINCENIVPSVSTSFSLCYNETKEVKFIITSLGNLKYSDLITFKKRAKLLGNNFEGVILIE